jgi:ubiquitin carboxyl-terminal hydrolase 8
MLLCLRISSQMECESTLNLAKNRHDGKRANRDVGVYQSAPKEYPSRSYLPSPPPTSRHTASNSLSYPTPAIVPPPQSHPGPGARRRSDYVEHHNQTYSGYNAPLSPRQGHIDYPAPHALGSIPKPAPSQSHVLERHGVPRSQSIRALDLIAKEEGEVRYWNDVALGMTGLKNLGK